MTGETGPLASAERDSWYLAAIQALCATLNRRAIDRYANVHDDQEQADTLIRFLALAGEVLREQSTLEAALDCLEEVATTDVETASVEGSGGDDECEPPWEWDPVSEQCKLPGS